jgi:uncharacterized protein YdiU (UPF0061 family)
LFIYLLQNCQQCFCDSRNSFKLWVLKWKTKKRRETKEEQARLGKKMRAANPTPNISEIVSQKNPRKYTKNKSTYCNR